MKKIATTMSLLIMFISILTGCAQSTEKVTCKMEANLQTAAGEYKEYIESQMQEGVLELVKEDGMFKLIDEPTQKQVYYVTIPDDFYEWDDPYKKFQFTETGELPEENQKFLEEAKVLAKDYIDLSNIIKQEQKEALKETISNVSIHYGTFGESEKVLGPNSLMVTHGTDIYVNEEFKDYVVVHTFLHELIHVITNETNRGSKYELSYYRFSTVNEAITELITREIMMANGKESEMIQTTYEVYFEYSLALMGKSDLLTAYFYSENYDNIIETFGKDWVDVYYLLVNSCPVEDLAVGVPYWTWSQM